MEILLQIVRLQALMQICGFQESTHLSSRPGGKHRALFGLHELPPHDIFLSLHQQLSNLVPSIAAKENTIPLLSMDFLLDAIPYFPRENTPSSIQLDEYWSDTAANKQKKSNDTHTLINMWDLAFELNGTAYTYSVLSFPHNDDHFKSCFKAFHFSLNTFEPSSL